MNRNRMNFREMGRCFKCSSGMAAVEAAMIMPFLIVFLFGCIEFSRSLFIQSELQHAIHQTARSVMLNPDATVTEIQTAIKSNLSAVVNTGNLASVTAVKGTDADGNATVDLTIVYSFQFFIPFLSSDPIQLTATQSIVTG